MCRNQGIEGHSLREAGKKALDERKEIGDGGGIM
jgi:hypothetical protein